MRPAGLTMPTDGPSTHCVIFQSGLPVAPKHLFRSFSSPECANGRLHHPIHPDRGRCGRAEGSNEAALRPPHLAESPCPSTSSGAESGRKPFDKLGDRGRSRALRQAQEPRVVATPFDRLRDRGGYDALRQAQGPRWLRRPSTSSGTEGGRAPFNMLRGRVQHEAPPSTGVEDGASKKRNSAVTRP
jgi:hypothetical protein